MNESPNKITPKLWLAEAVIVILALVALRKGNPHSYYIVLRWVACPLFCWIAWKAFSLSRATLLVILAGVLAVLYNPVLRVILSRDKWEIVNIVMIGIAIWSALLSIRGARPAQ